MANMVGIGQVKVEDVVQVYSGKPGCGCGCRGNYRVNPSHLEMANKERGYDYGRKDVSLMQVKSVLHILQEAEASGPGTVEIGEAGKNMLVYSLETEKRYRWVYVKRQ